jgi:membrane protein
MLDRLRAFQRTRFARGFWALLVNLDRYAASRAASAMAFDAFLSLIPLVAGAGVILHRLHTTSAATLGPLLRPMPFAVAQLIDGEFLRLSDAGFAVFAPLVLCAFAWVSAGGLSTAMGVFECIYIGVERPWWKRRFIAMGYVFAGLVVVTILTALGIVIAGVSKTAGVVLGFLLPVVAPVALVAGFFRIATQRTGGPKRRVLPGAVLTVVLWGASSTLFSFYVSRIASYATLYGNLATVAIALLWLWIASLALLVGGEVNALMDGIGLDDEVPESVFPFEGNEDDLPGGDLRTKSILPTPPPGAAAETGHPPAKAGGQRA